VDHEVVVIGAGFGGIGAGVALRRAGIDDFVILERSDDIGGTWHTNTYPGVAVDVPSFSYQFSFAKNPRWSRVFARGAEVKAYIDDCADRFGLRPHLRLGCEVVAREWDEAAHLWRLRLGDGRELSARYVVSAIGAFVDALEPEIEGLGDFAGKLIRSQAWDHAYDLSGKRVAVIGTGASAVQIIPEVARRAGRLDVYQRRPIWLFAKGDRRISPRTQAVLARVPGAQSVVRFAMSALLEWFIVGTVVFGKRLPLMTRIPELGCRLYLRSQVRDPELRRKLTPQYGFGCKRPGMSNHYYRAFTRPTTELVTEPIERVTTTGIRTADGVEREIDVLVLATGFRLSTDPAVFRRSRVSGRDGLDLAEVMERDSLRTYEGVSMPGFQNLFTIFGPYSWTGASWHVMVETQSHHIVRVLGEAQRRGATAVEVRPEAVERFMRFVRGRTAEALPLSRACDAAGTYYRDHHGEVSLLRPTSSMQAWAAARRFPLEDYEFRSAQAAGALARAGLHEADGPAGGAAAPRGDGHDQ
jgi:cation diffusion facilitator CzcD-associated flavoprotein CzcO